MSGVLTASEFSIVLLVSVRIKDGTGVGGLILLLVMPKNIV